MAHFRSILTQYQLRSQGRGGGSYSPPNDMSTNGKNTTFLALWRLYDALEWTK